MFLTLLWILLGGVTHNVHVTASMKPQIRKIKIERWTMASRPHSITVSVPIPNNTNRPSRLMGDIQAGPSWKTFIIWPPARIADAGGPGFFRPTFKVFEGVCGQGIGRWIPVNVKIHKNRRQSHNDYFGRLVCFGIDLLTLNEAQAKTAKLRTRGKTMFCNPIACPQE